MRKIMQTVGTATIAALAVAGLATGCQQTEKQSKQQKPEQVQKKVEGAQQKVAEAKNIVQTAMASSDLSTLVSLLQTADLVATLEGQGPFTVFAPTNEAFNKLGKAKLDELRSADNRERLRQVLLFHVVSGDVTAEKLADMSRLKTVEGGTVAVTKRNGKMYVGNAEVIGADIEASNGVVHLIDKVLMPPTEK